MAANRGAPLVGGAPALLVLVMGAVLLMTHRAEGEMLPFDPKACPAALPRAACFGSAESLAADWRGGTGVALPRLGETVAYVQSLLQTAIEVEHSTIPLYLTTAYSIVNQSSFEATTMLGVVMEEMLHMVNAANVLNAIGGAPSLDHPDFIPTYPLVMPFLNMSADVVWFTKESVQHYQILESTPPGGYNTSISAAYLQITNLLKSLCQQHGEASVFTGNRSLQVEATLGNGQVAPKVFGLAGAVTSLMGVADQGGGCPVEGQPWPEMTNISAGPLGGGVSHAARYEEILLQRAYEPDDKAGKPTGAAHHIDYRNVRRFTPNPAISDFLPASCVAGGKWVVRRDQFFVSTMLSEHGRLDNSTETSWQDCAKKCEMWTIDNGQPLAPCAMWTWRALNSTGNITTHNCMLAQGGGPDTSPRPGFMSGCQYGTVCSEKLPHVGAYKPLPPPDPSPALSRACEVLHVKGVQFASNYTALLVQLHNVFNGQPALLDSTIGAMYTLKGMAIELMNTQDPREQGNQMGVGPPWAYVKEASHYALRGGNARPVYTEPEGRRDRGGVELTSDVWL